MSLVAVSQEQKAAVRSFCAAALVVTAVLELRHRLELMLLASRTPRSEYQTSFGSRTVLPAVLLTGRVLVGVAVGFAGGFVVVLACDARNAAGEAAACRLVGLSLAILIAKDSASTTSAYFLGREPISAEARSNRVAPLRPLLR
jgi:hypothetical protein